MRPRPRGRAAFAVLTLLAGGCGSTATDFPREPVIGKVTVDGRPLEDGLITFTPTAQPEPVVSAVVRGGEFTLPRADGPAPGPHRVEVWSQKATGKKVRDPDRPGETVDEIVQAVPERYNARSSLTAEVRPGAANAFEFPLSSARPQGKQASRGRAVRR